MTVEAGLRPRRPHSLSTNPCLLHGNVLDLLPRRLRRIGGTKVYRIGTVAPGHVRELEARFLPGGFQLWCSLADHRARGMRASLVVKKA